MNKVYCYCYHPCTTIVHFLFSEKTCSCTFGIPINKAFKMCLKGTKNSHSYLNSFFDPDVVKQRCRKCFKMLSMDHIPKRPRVQASRAAGSRRYTHTLIHNHARTHARTHAHTHTHSLLGTGKPRTATSTFTQLLSSDLTAQNS